MEMILNEADRIERLAFEKWAKSALPHRLYMYEEKRGYAYADKELTYAYKAWMAAIKEASIRSEE